MSNVYLVDGLRTPFGSFNGIFADVSAVELGAVVMKGILEKNGLVAEAVDEVIVGQVLTGGCGQAPARQAMRRAGLPDQIPAMTINKVCGSGLKSIMLGCDSIRLGNAGLVLAGGMENMTQAPYVLKKGRNGYRMGHGEILDLMIYDGLQDPYSGRHMGLISEESVLRGGLTREEQDQFAARSYRRSRTAVSEGLFRSEIVPVIKPSKGGDIALADDEEPFKGDPDKLGQLRPVFSKEGSITAGNASSINDGAAMALLADEAACTRHELVPKARIVAYATESRHPDQFTDAPIGAIQKACARAGLTPDQIDLYEINEAFALVPLLAIKALGLESDKVNVNGGACSIGHPIGASGARLAITLVRELHRRQLRYGLATLCIGGGEAVAVIFERV